MPVVVLIRRVVREDKVDDFLMDYHKRRPSKEDGFLAEYLTRIDNVDRLPDPMKGLLVPASVGFTYVNVAFWRSVEDFIKIMNPEITCNSDFELEDRQRVVVNIHEENGGAPGLMN